MGNLIKKENLKGNKVDILVPHNYPYLEVDLNENMLDYLWKIVKKAKDKAVCAKYTLAGNISNSYRLIDENDYFFNELLKPLIKLYFENNRKKHPDLRVNQVRMNSDNVYNLSSELSDFWVNYQYKHEFNPIHSHAGVYSFVIWLKIPYDWEDQKKLPQYSDVKDQNIKAGCFEFEYIDPLGVIQNLIYKLSPKLEGYMVFFPARLRHCVYPFYDSDKPRISIAGNLNYLPA